MYTNICDEQFFCTVLDRTSKDNLWFLNLKEDCAEKGQKEFRMKLLYIAIPTRVIGCYYKGLKEEAKECKIRDRDFGRKAG